MDSNNQQINTWSGGMNTDTSDALLSNNLYRYAENLRYITETDSNTGELHLIPGAKNILTIQEGEDPTITTYKILLATELRDLGIFITEYEEGWAVWTYNNGTGPLTKVFYTSDNSRVRGADSLSLVTKYENQDNLKLYIADQKGPVLIILLVVNADNVQETTDISDVSAYPSITFTKPQFLGLTSGQLKPGVVQYSYQYYNRYRQQSEISPTTKLIPLIQLYNNSTKGFLASDNTNIGTIIKINIPATINFERIRVFRIMYLQNGQLPTIEEIYNDDIAVNYNNGSRVDADLVVYDKGQSALSTLTLEEYNSITGIHIIPKTIESKDDYLFAGNIKDNSEAFDSLLSNIDFTSCPDANNTDDSTSYADYLDLSKPFKAPRYSGNGTKIGHQGSVISWYFVTTAIPFDYNSIDGVHNKLDYINRYCSYKNNNDALTFYVYDSEGYSNPDNALVFDSDVWNDNTYTNPVVLQEFKSLRRDEIYRYGIVLYNNKGESSSAKWIADIRTPDIKTLPTFGTYSDEWDSTFNIPSLTNNSGKQVAYPLGIHFEVNTSLFPSEVVAYEIVRCKREFSDMATISQGVISKTIRVKNDLLGNSTENPFTPTGYLLNTNFYCRGAVDANNRYTAETEAISPYLFVSPEADYTQDIFSMIPKNGLTLLPVSFIFPDIYNDLGNIDQNQNSPKRIKVGNDYAKMILGQGALLPQGTYESVEIVNERLTLVDPWPSDDNYYYAGNYVGHKYDVNRAAYIKLYKTSSIQSGVTEKLVNTVKLVEGLSYNDFADNSTNQHLKFKDKVTNIGQFNYVNWVVGGGWNLTYQQHVDAQSDYSNPSSNRFLMGPAGTCLVIDISGNTFPDVVQTYLNDPKITGSYLCNIRKSTIPYGGVTEASKKQSVYRSFGDLFNSTEQSVTIFDGDCYIMPFEHCTLHKWAYSEIGTYDKADLCVMYAFPVETNINLYATNGYEYSKEYGQHNQDTTFLLEQPSNVNDRLIQDIPQYVYNSVYSVTDSPRMFAADDTEYTELNQDYRVYNSLLKSSNEYIDSWLKFQPANYIDLDSRLGQITGLRRFKNQLIFWQDNATGILSVNERSLITDHDKMPLILGSGDVLSRYDYITTSNGMKIDQYADAQSESTLYWWDYVRKELCAYQSGQGYNILSKSKFVLNYINEHANIETPALVFDKQYNELIASIVNNESLVYNELIGNFISVYKIHPLYHIQFSDKLLLMNNNSADVFQWNKVQHDGVSIGMDPTATDLLPKIKYVVNKGADTTKVFDNGEIAGRFYGGDHDEIDNIRMEFKTPLKQQSLMTGASMTNREYNFRYAIPRAGDALLGNRMRGKSMRASISSDSNSLDFSIQYIMTKFRVSWS